MKVHVSFGGFHFMQDLVEKTTQKGKTTTQNLPVKQKENLPLLEKNKKAPKVKKLPSHPVEPPGGLTQTNFHEKKVKRYKRSTKKGNNTPTS